MSDCIKLEKSGHIGTLTIDLPNEKVNILRSNVMDAISSTLEELKEKV